MPSFVIYLLLDALLAAYLGMWNAMVPFVLLARFGTASVVIYEMALAVCAVIALPLAATWTERLPRGRVMRGACGVIALTGVSRLAAMSATQSLVFWVVNDVIAVIAFAVVQPLLSLYPAETPGRARVLSAFRLRRVVVNLGRVGGPLLAAGALARWRHEYAMGCVAILGCFLIPPALRLPVWPATKVAGGTASTRRETHWRLALAGFVLKFRLPAERFFSLQDILLGVATAGVVPILIPQLVRCTGLDDSQVGWLVSMFVAGSIGGVVLVHPLLSGVLRRRPGYLSVWVALCASLVTASASSAVVALGAALMAAGIFGACLSMTGVDRRVMAMPSSVRIRVASATLLTGQFASLLSFAFYGASSVAGTEGGQYGWYVGVACTAALAAGVSREPWRLLTQRDARDEVETFYLRRYPDLFGDDLRRRPSAVIFGGDFRR
ncbi:hypothetical protein AB870_05145 [Pandoraea faecigallinarum]|uniref:Major facilitator superfamily (MFS) profile domain-containing protein n=1 Tax=Pandoraea faecigallinarum TaxID=656179 RepID=A0A0H3WQ20_9BURK|nr:MFS transporter [Pandoraea faecigallinarum]AKM29645.1 hypothetical protein AB870_05145 [Pandoraea faecigallinarum]